MPTACHMQDRGKTHTFSSHDSAEVRTPAPIITACFIVCSTCLTMKNALLVFFVCLFCDKKGANRSHLSELTSQRHVSNIYSGELAGIFGLAMNIQYIHRQGEIILVSLILEKRISLRSPLRKTRFSILVKHWKNTPKQNRGTNQR